MNGAVEADVLRARQVAQLQPKNRTTATADSGHGPETEIYDAATLERPPRAKFQAIPRYPDELKTAGVSGEVVVDLVVDHEGKPLNIHAVKSSHPAFEASTIKSVKLWKYLPARIGIRKLMTAGRSRRSRFRTSRFGRRLWRESIRQPASPCGRRSDVSVRRAMISNAFKIVLPDPQHAFVRVRGLTAKEQKIPLQLGAGGWQIIVPEAMVGKVEGWSRGLAPIAPKK